MNFTNRIKEKLRYRFSKQIKPELIGGWLNPNGNFSKNTRISNMSDISYKNDNLYIGDHVFINHFSYIDAKHSKIYIANEVQICTNVCILTHSTHNTIRLVSKKNSTKIDTDFLSNHFDVYIGENTYIGPNSIIMPGAKIGKGCIISAFSYVKGEIPDFSILRGQPAKIIGNTKDIDSKYLNKYDFLNETYYLNNESN
jgi:acetyltransferase-like isoleucine patch superfamily enzyme